MNELGKFFIFVGFLFIVIGVLILFFGKIVPFGKLPGDIYIKRDNFTIYIPVTSAILVSVLLTLLINLIFLLFRR